jgi:hypothetical protein
MPEDNQMDAQSESMTQIIQTWNPSQEKLLKMIGERSNCMRWLHNECNLYFESLNFYFTIPNVVISTVNGSITMSLNTLFPEPESQRTATTIIGLVSIFSAILITMNQYMKSQQMSEAHRAAGLAYGKLHRLIMNELAMRRDQRSNGEEFLKQIRAEIDRLENVSPLIRPGVIHRFNKEFAHRKLEKPEITGDLDEVEINEDGRPDSTLLEKKTSINSLGELAIENPLPFKALETPPKSKPSILSSLFGMFGNGAKGFESLPATPENIPAMSQEAYTATMASLESLVPSEPVPASEPVPSEPLKEEPVKEEPVPSEPVSQPSKEPSEPTLNIDTMTIDMGIVEKQEQ